VIRRLPQNPLPELAILLAMRHSRVYSVFMSDQESKITREELYSMVWTRSFVRLANELGYSYPELVTLCADLNIPRPSGGYWYRLAHGGAEDQTPLPTSPPGKPTEIPYGPRKGKADVPPLEPAAEAETTEPNAEVGSRTVSGEERS
jgi:hypothetical protein